MTLVNDEDVGEEDEEESESRGTVGASFGRTLWTFAVTRTTQSSQSAVAPDRWDGRHAEGRARVQPGESRDGEPLCVQ